MLIITLRLQRVLKMWLALRQAETARVLDELLVRRLRGFYLIRLSHYVLTMLTSVNTKTLPLSL